MGSQLAGEVFLLRHLATAKNLGGIYIGQIDDPIILDTEINYGSFQFGNNIMLVCSPLARCIQTVGIFTSDLLNLSSSEVSLRLVKSNLILERDMGDFSGQDKTLIRQRYANYINEDMLDPYFTPPSGESFPKFLERIRKFYEKLIIIRRKFVGQLVICGHVHVFRALKCIHYDLDIQNSWHSMKFSHGTITRL